MVVALILCAMRLVSGTANESWGEPDDALLLQTRAVGKTGPCDEELRGPKDAGYRGCQTHTRSGRKCQKWNEQSPHRNKWNTPERKPGKGLGAHNYCRNPDGEPTIWCYTMDSGTRWELCDPHGANMPQPNKITDCAHPDGPNHPMSCGYYKTKCDSLAETLYDCFEDWLQCEHILEICSDEETTLSECYAGVHGANFLPHPGFKTACSHSRQMREALIQQGCQKYADAIQGPVFDALQQCQRWGQAEQRRCLEGPVSIVKALCYEHMECFVGSHVNQRIIYAANECVDKLQHKTPAETLFCGMCGYGDCPTGWDTKDWASVTFKKTAEEMRRMEGLRDFTVESPPTIESFLVASGVGHDPQPELVDMLQSRSDAGELNADEEVSVTGGLLARRSERRVFEEEHFARFEEVLSEKACDRKCNKKSVKSAR